MMELPPQVDTALALLEGTGFEAFLVGGAVRDFVRGQRGKDWDLATNALPEQVKAAFTGFHLIETGLKHGTVTAVIDRLPMEITTYRIDGKYSDHRRPDAVTFSRNLKDDLTRRDFTMNALAYHPKTGIVDLVGGMEDIRQGRIRCVGDPNRRFQEDGLRMLRALRFASVFGMEIEQATAAALFENMELLRGIAVERVQTELTKLLCGAGVGSVLREYAAVLAVPLPEIVPMFGFDQRNPHHDRDVWEHTIAVVSAIPPDPALRWAALLHDIGKPGCFSVSGDGVGHFYGHGEKSTQLAGEILARLRFDNGSKERIQQLVRLHDRPIPAEKKPVKRLLSKYGVETARQLILLHQADASGQAPMCRGRMAYYETVNALIDEIIREQSCFSLRDLAINGHDLTALGLRGRQVGETLRLCLEAVMEEQVENTREELLRLARGD